MINLSTHHAGAVSATELSVEGILPAQNVWIDLLNRGGRR